MILALFLATVLSALSPTSHASNCTAATAFVGTICTPTGAGKHPAILLLGGSEGGNQMSSSAPRFASAGYVAASVAYFGSPGLPAILEEIPVETVGKALQSIGERPDVEGNRVAIFGISKGGELALLVAATYPQIHAVVADVPSPFAWQSIPHGPEATQHSSWTLGGKPLPFVPYSTSMGQGIARSFQSHLPLDLRVGYVASMKENASAIPAAMFHLENVHGPIFFLAADDDHIWDSVAQSELGMAYLSGQHHPYSDAYRLYGGAGHIFLFATPQRPMTEAPIGPVRLLLGGTPASNVAAAAQAWPQIMQFLKDALSSKNAQ